MKKIVNNLLLSFVAGVLIAIGGTVFLSCVSKYLGALLFSVGLFFIVEGKYKLYTGAIGYLLDNKKEDNFQLFTILIGNFLGTFLVANILKVTRLASALLIKSEELVSTKLNDSWYSILFLSFMCGILIYLGVDNFKKSLNNFSKVLGIIFCVVVFIVSGFEHCVANMFYFCVASVWSFKAILYILIMIIGNSLGGLLIPSIIKISKKLE